MADAVTGAVGHRGTVQIVDCTREGEELGEPRTVGGAPPNFDKQLNDLLMSTFGMDLSQICEQYPTAKSTLITIQTFIREQGLQKDWNELLNGLAPFIKLLTGLIKIHGPALQNIASRYLLGNGDQRPALPGLAGRMVTNAIYPSSALQIGDVREDDDDDDDAPSLSTGGGGNKQHLLEDDPARIRSVDRSVTFWESSRVSFSATLLDSLHEWSNEIRNRDEANCLLKTAVFFSVAAGSLFTFAVALVESVGRIALSLFAYVISKPFETVDPIILRSGPRMSMAACSEAANTFFANLGCHKELGPHPIDPQNNSRRSIVDNFSVKFVQGFHNEQLREKGYMSQSVASMIVSEILSFFRGK